MKHGKNPTLAQKKFIAAKRLKPENWLIVKDTPEEMVLVSKENAKNGVNKQKVILKEQRGL